jgi:alpha-L-arabinofuranosidase
MYGQNAGDLYLASDVKLSDNNPDVRKRIAMSVVKDSKTGDVMVKLVNVLPVAINAKVQLDGVNIFPQTAQKTLLTGNLNEKHMQPTAGTVQVDKAFDCQLPAYSFIVIRIRGKKVGK